ncbi:protein KRI1 homolog [Acanthochromis polyacanthus]|uniref:protein KRI1 homolog n=1 Tax=Acanthochromis polyacanthus TaxID=80966 RepID=UPI0022340462|nr:protein KRI1 homolog [Acanthochromis polyacanthus]
MSGKSELKINSQFAQKYDKYRQKEELQRLKDRYGDRADDSDSESSESSSDDSEVELDPEVERDFYRTLSLLKKKDPKIYEKDAKFYSEEASTSDAKPSTSKKAVKPMYLKDYERKVILEKEGKYEDDDDSDDEEAARRRERAASPSYMQEQKELKESFRKFIQDSDDDDDDAADEGGEGGGTQLLTRRIKTQEEKDKEEADYVDWLKGQAELEGPEEVKDMKYLKDYWNDPELDEKECFLRDYVLNKGYLDEDEDDERIPTYDEVVQDDVEDSEEEGESFLERQEDFERSYNFRFEEPDSQQVKTYPRNIATSVRSKDDRRKRKREEIKERKEKEKEQKQEQLKQLKNLKRNEIMEKLKMLQELTGNEQLAFSQADLEGDFDPKQHDQLMQKYFGDEYYGEEEEEKPQFEDDDELEEHWNWDTWTGEGREEEEYGEEEEEYEADEPHCDDENFIMDADFDPSQQTASKKKKKERKKMKKEDMPQMGKKRKKSHFAEVITKNKPVFDPQEKSFEQYLDEYYKLDFEDIIDDLPCRFRYRQVLANDFGLTTDEILNANDNELNRWSSLKKTCMFRSEKEEMSDLRNYKIKAQNERKKKEILSSVYSEEAKDLTEAKTKVGKKRRDRLKNAEKQGREDDDEVSTMESAEETLGQSLQEAEDDMEEKGEEFLIPKKKIKRDEEPEITTEEAADQPDEVRNRTERPKWSKRKPKRSQGGSAGVKIGGREFSRQRLKAYGLNPKRLYFRQLGRQKRKAQEKKEKQEKQGVMAPVTDPH